MSVDSTRNLSDFWDYASDSDQANNRLQCASNRVFGVRPLMFDSRFTNSQKINDLGAILYRILVTVNLVFELGKLYPLLLYHKG
jgi:hypothetical protein